MSTVNLAVALWTNHLSDTGGFPACMSKREFQDWADAESEAPTKPIRQFSCRDCDVAYQKHRVSEGRCAIPNINVARIAK